MYMYGQTVKKKERKGKRKLTQGQFFTVAKPSLVRLYTALEIGFKTMQF